jgi:hypothetical protein
MSHSWDGKTFIRTSQIREVIEHQFTATSENDWCDIPVGGVVVWLLDDLIPRRVHEKRFQYGECYLAERPLVFADTTFKTITIECSKAE